MKKKRLNKIIKAVNEELDAIGDLLETQGAINKIQSERISSLEKDILGLLEAEVNRKNFVTSLGIRQ